MVSLTDGHKFEQPPGVGDGQGSLACCSPWGRKESEMTGPELNWALWSVFLIITYTASQQ